MMCAKMTLGPMNVAISESDIEPEQFSNVY